MANSESPISPIIKETSRICNYTQLIALLKLKQLKYKNYSYKTVNNSFTDVLNNTADLFNIEDIIEGYLHGKLKDRFETYEAEVDKNFKKLISNKIQEIKKNNEQQIYSVKISNIKDEEDFLFSSCTKHSFNDDLLFDLYIYLRERKEPLEFLHESYYKYIKTFMMIQKPSFVDKNRPCFSSADNGQAIKDMVSEYVRLRFNREEFSIEAYEGRYLWAEIYVLARIGRRDLVKELLAEYEIFFEFMAQKFKTAFLEFLSGKTPNFVFTLVNSDDKFKRLLFSLTEGKPKSDGIAIGTIEDYLWMKMTVPNSSRTAMFRDLSHFDNPKTIFMVCLLIKKYKKAIEVLLRSDFCLVAKFFLLRELCLEQALDLAVEKAESGFRGQAPLTNRPLLKNKAYVDESSSFSLASERTEKEYSYHDHGLSEINPIFLNFMFNIAVKLSSNEKKIKFIEMLKHHGDYYMVVPYYIIKYGMFEVVGKSDECYGDMGFYLDNEIATRVIQQLKETGSKNKLIKLHKLLPDDTMVMLLLDVVEEAILLDEKIDTKIVESYINRLDGRETVRLRGLHGLYKFNVLPSIANLRNSVVFDSSANLSEYKFVIEKIIGKAVDVVKAENDCEMAKMIFKLGGTLDLNEENCNKIARDLVMII